MAAPPRPSRRKARSPGSQWFYDRAGGLLVPIAATFLAFLIGGLVVLITEKSLSAPFEAYKAIFEGTGLTWFIPWDRRHGRGGRATSSRRSSS